MSLFYGLRGLMPFKNKTEYYNFALSRGIGPLVVIAENKYIAEAFVKDIHNVEGMQMYRGNLFKSMPISTFADSAVHIHYADIDVGMSISDAIMRVSGQLIILDTTDRAEYDGINKLFIDKAMRCYDLIPANSRGSGGHNVALTRHEIRGCATGEVEIITALFSTEVDEVDGVPPISAIAYTMVSNMSFADVGGALGLIKDLIKHSDVKLEIRAKGFSETGFIGNHLLISPVTGCWVDKRPIGLAHMCPLFDNIAVGSFTGGVNLSREDVDSLLDLLGHFDIQTAVAGSGSLAFGAL